MTYLVLPQEAYTAIRDRKTTSQYINSLTLIFNRIMKKENFILIGDNIFNGVDKVFGFDTELEAKEFIQLVKEINQDYKVPVLRVLDKLIERENFFKAQDNALSKK